MNNERARTTAAPPRTDPTASRPKRFLKCLGKELMKDNIDNVGAMMAYYAILALFPMVVFVVTMGMLVLPTDTIMDGLRMGTQAMPAAARDMITKQVTSLVANADAGFAIGSAVIALWGASRGAVALSAALNVMFNKTETRPWLKRQLIAIGVTLGVAVLMVVALGLLVIGPTAGHYVADRFGLGGVFDVLWGIGRWVGAGVLVMTVWAILYKFLPNTDAPLRIFTPGAIVGVALWLAISLAFGFYLDNFGSYEATYGALGGGIIFLTWLWLSNIALLLGAEINDVLADMRKDVDPAAAQLADDEEAERADPEVAAKAHVAQEQSDDIDDDTDDASDDDTDDAIDIEHPAHRTIPPAGVGASVARSNGRSDGRSDGRSNGRSTRPS